MTHGYEWFLEYDYVDLDFEDYEFDDIMTIDDDISAAWSELDKIADEFSDDGDYDYDF